MLPIEGATEVLLTISLQWHRIIHDLAGFSDKQPLTVYSHDAKGFEFIASAHFQRLSPTGRSAYHRLHTALDDGVSVPYISIDKRAFTLTPEETGWLIENLMVAGYLASIAGQLGTQMLHRPIHTMARR